MLAFKQNAELAELIAPGRPITRILFGGISLGVKGEAITSPSGTGEGFPGCISIRHVLRGRLVLKP